jgi:hypothetical protein
LTSFYPYVQIFKIFELKRTLDEVDILVFDKIHFEGIGLVSSQQKQYID